MINVKKILSALILACFIYPITINSELIEFNNKFFIPNDYNPYTGEVQDFYLKSNALKLEGNYLNGLKHGIFTHYFENGNVYKKENFLKGKLVGDLLEFNKDGNLIYKKSFKDEGFVYTSFYKDSKIQCRYNIQRQSNHTDVAWVEIGLVLFSTCLECEMWWC